MEKRKLTCSVYKVEKFIIHTNYILKKNVKLSKSESDSSLFQSWRHIFKLYMKIAYIVLLCGWSVIMICWIVHAFLFQKYLLWNWRKFYCFCWNGVSSLSERVVINVEQWRWVRNCGCLHNLLDGQL